MALNIDLVNGAINVYETGKSPRTYFGAIGASGKFYQSGSVDNGIGSVILSQNNSQGLADGDYFDVPISSTSGNGVNAKFFIEIIDGSIVNFNPTIYGNGYAIGDTVTIDASNLGGTGAIIFKVSSIQVDSLLIVIGGDDYQVKWSDLIINGDTPGSLSSASTLLATLFSSSQTYKVYSALLTQSGINNPTAIVLENTLGFTPTWYWSNDGYYSTNEAFDDTKTTVSISNNTAINIAYYNITSAIASGGYGAITIYTQDTNSVLNRTPIEIRVYN